MGVGVSYETVEWLYTELYRCMITKDCARLSAILDEDFILEHMTGMRQDKRAFIHAVEDGTLNYYSAEHKNIRLDGMTLTCDSLVSAAVFDGGRHIWRLRLTCGIIERNGGYFIGKIVASTF